jgi:hypothetical protein
MSAEEKQNELNGFGKGETPPELKAFEAALAALIPRTDRLDRDRLMFLAGRESQIKDDLQPVASPVRYQRTWTWPTAFAGMSVVAASLFVMLILRPGPQTANQIVARTVKQPVESADSNAKAGEPFVSTPSDISETFSNDNWPNFGSFFSLFFGEPKKASIARLPGADGGGLDSANALYSHSALLKQMLAQGADSWKPRTTGSHESKPVIAQPMTSRELLDEYLKESATGPI